MFDTIRSNIKQEIEVRDAARLHWLVVNIIQADDSISYADHHSEEDIM